MTRYFAQNTPRAGLEHMMMSVPGFQKRGGGMMILSRFCYKPEDVDCRYCLHYRRRSCQVRTCPYIYLQSFAPDMDLQEFEERVCCVMENRMLVDVIDRALLRLKRYPDRGELYYEILTKQFIHRFNSTEKELLDELNMERSVFYDRKREAIFLLSLCLFGYAVPELQEELEMPRLYPD